MMTVETPVLPRDMPKLKSPFVRDTIKGRYLVTPEIAEDYEWVFEDDTVMAIEKLDGTNVSVITQARRPIRVFNRTTEIPFYSNDRIFITMGMLESFTRGYTDLPSGQHFGELIGPKVQGNGYDLPAHLWIPFGTYAKKHLRYKTWGRYPKTFEAISAWFREDLHSLFYMRIHKGAHHPAEGIVFTHPDGRMAKLRRNMFDWYGGKRR